jgi:hypothetical protein
VHQYEISCEMEKKLLTECVQMLKEVNGDNVMSHMRVFEWHKRFVEGQEEVEDNECPGHPSTSKTEEKVEKISEFVRKDWHLSIQMFAKMVNMDKEMARQILHYQLNIRKTCAKMSKKPHSLTKRQLEKHLL